MQNRILLIPIILLVFINSPITSADEIMVKDADNVWKMPLENATDVGRLIGEPGVMIVKYADGVLYKSLDNATDIGRLTGEPGIMVVKYADGISYKPLDNVTDIGRLIGESCVMVIKYADAFMSLHSTPPFITTGNETVSIGSVTVDVNDTIVVPITIANASNIQLVALDLIYDSDVVTILNITPSDAIPSSTFTYTLDTGKAAMELISHDNITVTNATALIDIRFKAGKNTSSTALELLNVELIDDTGSHAPYTIVNGSITVCIKGNSNYNEIVDIGDIPFPIPSSLSEDRYPLMEQ